MSMERRKSEQPRQVASTTSPFVIWFSTTPLATWVVKHIASRLDPVIFRATRGRLTSMGVPTMPMLTLTALGRRSGRPRSVQLAYVAYDGDYLVAASAMGQAKHPAWRYNVEANPQVQIQVRGERFAAEATVLTDAEKRDVWSAIRKAIPQITVYEARTARNIRVVRLRRRAA